MGYAQYIQYLVPCLIVFTLVSSLALARDLFLPLVLASLLALLLSPSVKFLHNIGLPKFLSSLIMTLFSALAMFSSVWVAVPAMAKWMQTAPEKIKAAIEADKQIQSTIDKLQETSEKVDEMVADLVENSAETSIVIDNQAGWVDQIFTGLQTSFGVLIIVLTLTLFMLNNGGELLHNLTKLSNNRQTRRRAIKLFRRLRTEVGRYLATVLIINLICGLLTSLIVWYFDLPMPWVWLVLVTLLRFIPYIGVAVICALMFAISVSQMQAVLPALMPVGAFLLLTNITGMLIDPYVHGIRLRINPIIVFAAVLFWAWLWGIAGAIVAVPMLTILSVTARTLEWQSVNQIMEGRK
ncbi:AI-2E family transporter (plasmid) [Catenovulum sp. SX2]|uniref:AI-2E family transporter n=1 Tax=Catenovulum sp. SX2 TaxID=3398614 RepID=UPI003F83D1D8